MAIDVIEQWGSYRRYIAIAIAAAFHAIWFLLSVKESGNKGPKTYMAIFPKVLCLFTRQEECLPITYNDIENILQFNCNRGEINVI